MELLQRALELCTEAGDEDSRASTLCNLGSAMISVGSLMLLVGCWGSSGF